MNFLNVFLFRDESSRSQDLENFLLQLEGEHPGNMDVLIYRYPEEAELIELWNVSNETKKT